MSSKRKQALERLLKPRHIVFVGGANLATAIQSTERMGFSGDLWVVHPKHETISGYRCYKKISDLPCAPDAAFIAVNNQQTVETVGELVAMGAGGSVCYAAGFAEMGGKGQLLQEALKNAAGETFALIGPNCYGILNYCDGASLWADRHGGQRLSEGVAFISQSGNFALNLTMTARSCPFAYAISVGNQAVLAIPELIDAMLDDPRVRAIGLYLEGLNDVAAFAKAATRALQQGVPIVALKVGASVIGAHLSVSHTSTLSGADELYSALFERLGVIRATSAPHLTESLKLCASKLLPQGNRVTVLTCSGGDSAIAADCAETVGLQLPPLTREQEIALKPQLPEFASLGNPLDYNTMIWGKVDELMRCFSVVLDRDESDATLLALDIPPADIGDNRAWLASVQALIAVVETKKPKKPVLLASIFPELLPEPVRRLAMNAGITPLQGLDCALASLADVARYVQTRQRFLAQETHRDLYLAPQGAADAGAQLWNEWDSKQALAAYGIPIPAAQIGLASDMPHLAKALGFPVALKLVSADVPHKTEMGAVRLGLTQPQEVARAVSEIAARVEQAGLIPPPQGWRFMVEPMIGRAVAELILGSKYDPQFGQVLVVGSGGILVELLRDSRVILLPADRRTICEAVQRLRIFPLLEGFRGRARGDIEALIDAIAALGDFMTAKSATLLEIDINPLFVLPAGEGVIAVDALIRTRKSQDGDL